MTDVTVEVALPDRIESDVFAVPVTEGAHGDGIGDEKLAGRLAKLAEEGELSGELGTAIVLHTDGELQARRVAAAGVGPREAVDADAIRTAAAAVVRAVESVGGTLAWLLDESLPLPLPAQARAVVEGTLLGAYTPGRWKTTGKKRRPVEHIVLCARDPAIAEDGARAATVGRWVNAARDLANSPPNELTPESLAVRAAEISLLHLSVESLDPAGIDELGMGALAAVGRASTNGPRLIVLHYDPPSPVRSDVTLGLVGKAITFDAGGISLKPALRMYDMKGDMAGGAGVIGGVAAVAELRLPVRIVAVIAAAENLVGGDAFRPGDILRAANGKTIEITNTDAEGRLVLADALWYARREGATHLLDLATLTGAMELALGDLYAGLFANDDAWRDEIPGSCRRERRSHVAVSAASPLPTLRRLHVRRPEELVGAEARLAGARRRVPAGVRRRRAMGPHRHGRAGLPGTLTRRLPDAARRHRVGRPSDRRAGAAPRERALAVTVVQRRQPAIRAEAAGGFSRSAGTA